VRPLAPPGTAGAAIPVTPERPPLPAVDGKRTPEMTPSRDAVSPCEGLSPREIAVLRLLSEGHDVREIANDLGISIHTVRSYVKSILKKLDVRTQLQAVVLSARSGVLDLS
jgi:DNA-binding CsgD family transcriptional regulator